MATEQHHKLPRLFLAQTALSVGEKIDIPEEQAHYLRNVMRLQPENLLRVFNGQDGEFIAIVKEISKKKCIIEISQLIKEQKNARDIWVVAALTKKESFEWMVEKSSELGATRFIPVISEHSVVHKMNQERMTAIAVEAAEQSERLDVMQVDRPNNLKDSIKTWDKNRKLIFCIERSSAPKILEVVKNLQEPVAILVGPEGGFSEAEIDFITNSIFSLPVSLGDRILRSETALIFALSCLQAAFDDR